MPNLAMPGQAVRFSLRLALSAAALLSAVVVTGGLAPVAAAQVKADPVQASTEMLRRAATAQRDGSHLPLLFALRQLRDPDLKSLFRQLIQKHDWQIQVHAVLGLAEIDPKRQIDPWLITQITPEAQQTVIATALDLDLLPAERLTEILQYDQLHPMARLLALAERQVSKQPVDVEELARLSKSDDNHVAGLSTALLAQNGKADALAAFDQRLAQKPADERAAVTMWVIDAARRYELSAMLEWIAQRASDTDDPDLMYRAVFALLTLDPARGLPAWQKYLGEQPSYAHRVRAGTLLLGCGPKAPATAYDRLLPAGDDEQLIARIVETGKAIAAGTDPTEPMIALFDLGQSRTCLWAMDYLTKMPPQQSARVYQHLIDRMKQPRPEWSDGIAQAVQATSKLFDIDQAAVLERLKSVEDDSTLQQAMLLGLFETTSSAAGDAAAALPRIGSGRADSLALLLAAKHAKSLTPEQLKQLGTIASGGSRVSEVLQVQAAWLYLKRVGKTDQALAAVFAKSE